MCFARVLFICGGGSVREVPIPKSIMSRVDPFPDEPQYNIPHGEACYQISSLTCLPLRDRPMGHPLVNALKAKGDEIQI